MIITMHPLSTDLDSFVIRLYTCVRTVPNFYPVGFPNNIYCGVIILKMHKILVERLSEKEWPPSGRMPRPFFFPVTSLLIWYSKVNGL